MYRARVEAVSGLKVLAGGKWLRCIGNRAVRAGDFVWTDGRCVYGHDQITQTPLVIVNPAEDMAIPLLFFDKVLSRTKQNVTASCYTLFPNTKINLEYQGWASLSKSQNLFMINNKTECQFPAVVLKINESAGIAYDANVAINLDNQQNTYALQKSYENLSADSPTVKVRVLKNGQILNEIDCTQKVKEFKSEMLKYARENVGGSVTIPRDHWVIVYDPNSLHLYLDNDVIDVPDNAVGYQIVFPNVLSWDYYRIEYGYAYFDASIEGVIIRKTTSHFALYPGSPQNQLWYDVNTAYSNSYVEDFEIPWGVIEDENNWAFMVTALVDVQATGHYQSGDSAIPKNARVLARKTWIYTPTGAKDFYYSRFSRLDNNGTEIPSPKIEQSYPVSEPIPIQDGYYFRLNSAQLYWTAKYPMSDKQNAVMLNITVHDRDGGALWTGNVVVGTYLTICKNKKIWLGVDDRGGLGLYSPEFVYSSTGYSAISGDLTSGVYLLSEGQAELIIGGYLKNQKLRPMKKYKNWWEQIEGGEESE